MDQNRICLVFNRNLLYHLIGTSLSERMVIKAIEVLPYNPDWPKIYDVEAQKIQEALGQKVIATHHIGSTSVPGLAAKNDIDILLLIDNLDDSLKLENIGYIFKGELNVPLRYFFSKNTEHSKVNLHVCEPDHGFGALNLAFRGYLRQNPESVKTYETIKYNILKSSTAHEKLSGAISKYNSQKDEFIKSILKNSGFQGLSINFCMHERERTHYHRIKDEQIFRPIGIVYDRQHPSLFLENHYHFVLYQGVEIVGAAQVELLSSRRAAIRALAIDTPYQNRGLGSFFLKFIEKWLKYKNIKLILMHANVSAIAFYKKLGYIFMPFEGGGQHLSSESQDMGKYL